MRQRLEKGTALKTWEDVDVALGEMARLNARVGAIEEEYGKKIQALQEEELSRKSGLQALANSLLKNMEEFCAAHSEEIKGKSKALNNGRVGFRQSTLIEIEDMASTVKALRKKGLEEFVVIVETADKNALRRLEDKELEGIGAQRIIKETFFADSK